MDSQFEFEIEKLIDRLEFLSNDLKHMKKQIKLLNTFLSGAIGGVIGLLLQHFWLTPFIKNVFLEN